MLLCVSGGECCDHLIWTQPATILIQFPRIRALIPTPGPPPLVTFVIHTITNTFQWWGLTTNNHKGPGYKQNTKTIGNVIIMPGVRTSPLTVVWVFVAS